MQDIEEYSAWRAAIAAALDDYRAALTGFDVSDAATTQRGKRMGWLAAINVPASGSGGRPRLRLNRPFGRSTSTASRMTRHHVGVSQSSGQTGRAPLGTVCA